VVNLATEPHVLRVMVPVYVHIDDGMVSKVVVDDEALDLDTATLADVDEAWSPAEIKERRDRAVEIAGGNQSWPSWEFGW
jgi:hypothetical protein